MGRKTKLTKKVQDYICAAVEQGANVEMRCLNGGITVQTYLTWRRRGEAARVLLGKDEPVPDDEAPYLSFLEAVDEALASYGMQLQQVIAQHATRDPAEARRELQRLFPNDYAPPTQRTELTGKDGGPVATEIIIKYADDNDTPTASGPAPDTRQREAV